MGLIIIENSKIELKALIADSKLSDGQKELWYAFILASAEPDVVAILETVQEDATILNFLTENLEEKLEVMKTGDKNSWQDIVKKEKEYLESK